MILSLTPNSTITGIDNLMLKIGLTSTLEAPSRRHTRVATLDGESSIIDMGYSASDSDMQFIFDEVTRDIYADIIAVLTGSPLVVASVETGIYEGILSQTSEGTDPFSVTFRVKRKLNA